MEEIHANLIDRLAEAKEQGWLGEVAAIKTTIAAAAQKLEAMRTLAGQHTATDLGMPELRSALGRSCSSIRSVQSAGKSGPTLGPGSAYF
ncbi:hypothetical protein [Amycolatopsis sp.]|uniref:hypothetical protein n=1 Tax=Amycolatopsis sp. TaxID=37632 RepID=UPI00261CD8EB|nr:hypothetical protein [Amycolatopsis sp.]